MLGIVSGHVDDDIAPKSAIVLYGSPNTTHYGTVHPIDRIALSDALGALLRESAAKAEFITPNVLSLGMHSVAWWCPAAMRRVFFRCKELGERSAVVPHPALVFQASHTGFRVFALKIDARPTPKTALFEPPYFNTWNAGKICIGSAQVPDRIDVMSIGGWESGFFDSAFTHPNHGSKRVAYKDGEFAFWKAMLDGTFRKTFPRDMLVPMKKTLGDLIAGKLGD
jgi:PRTRC genetic system protein B